MPDESIRGEEEPQMFPSRSGTRRFLTAEGHIHAGLWVLEGSTELGELLVTTDCFSWRRRLRNLAAP